MVDSGGNSSSIIHKIYLCKRDLGARTAKRRLPVPLNFPPRAAHAKSGLERLDHGVDVVRPN